VHRRQHHLGAAQPLVEFRARLNHAQGDRFVLHGALLLKGKKTQGISSYRIEWDDFAAWHDGEASPANFRPSHQPASLLGRKLCLRRHPGTFDGPSYPTRRLVEPVNSDLFIKLN